MLGPDVTGLIVELLHAGRRGWFGLLYIEGKPKGKRNKSSNNRPSGNCFC
jgi:hypothetical protein